jgi:hypothetical protein
MGWGWRKFEFPNMEHILAINSIITQQIKIKVWKM